MKKIRKVAIACFYNNQNQILLQERGDYSKFGEEWAFFGGGIEEGETTLEGYKREIMEELGLDADVYDYEYMGEFIYECNELNLKVYRNIFIIKTDMKEEDFTVYEGAGAKYFSIEEAKKLKFPTDPSEYLEIINNYILGKK